MAAHPALTLGHGALHGTHFHPREKVHVTVQSASTLVRTVRTSSGGTFSMSLGDAADPCVGAVVLAVGAHGDTARLKVMPRGCLPPSTTP